MWVRTVRAYEYVCVGDVQWMCNGCAMDVQAFGKLQERRSSLSAICTRVRWVYLTAIANLLEPLLGLSLLPRAQTRVEPLALAMLLL